jgi:hypothetical protein
LLWDLGFEIQDPGSGKNFPGSRGKKGIGSRICNTGTMLEGPSKVDLGDGAFTGEKVFSRVFIKYNTLVPSSAAVE